MTVRWVGLVAVFMLGAWVSPYVAQERPDAVELGAGEAAPFAGVLLDMADFDELLQAKLDVPLLRQEIEQWERGHALAIMAMESAQEALKGCAPEKGILDKVATVAERLVPVLIAAQLCTGNGNGSG